MLMLRSTTISRRSRRGLRNGCMRRRSQRRTCLFAAHICAQLHTAILLKQSRCTLCRSTNCPRQAVRDRAIAATQAKTARQRKAPSDSMCVRRRHMKSEFISIAIAFFLRPANIVVDIQMNALPFPICPNSVRPIYKRRRYGHI